MTITPWREIAQPHQDVLKGTFQQAEFAADLSRVHDGSAVEEYQDASLFFERTFITEGMRLLLDSVVKRLSGQGGDPVIQLQTAFGGGKTHTMLAVYHLAKGTHNAKELHGVSKILDQAKIMTLPKAKIAVLDGIKLSPNQPVQRGNVLIHTLWGELAWQLGQEAGYSLVKDADLSGTSPGKEVLTKLFQTFSPCVILVDELVAYIRQFEEGKSFKGGTYDSNLSFIQALTESVKAVPNAVLLASLPESDKEAGSHRGVNALRALEHYFARVQAIWKPVATEEAFEIVRRRLFAKVGDQKKVESICRIFSDFYINHSGDFPPETQEGRYFERLVHAYPIHPEVFDRLYQDWSTLDNFQRTRGVLKLMAKVIHRLWKDGNNDALIMPGSLPLYDADTRNEAIQYLPAGWDPVIERDIDGEQAETTSIENQDTRLGSVQACRRTARTVFLSSAPTTSHQVVRGIEIERMLLGSVQPGGQTALFKDSLKRLSDRLHYLNTANHRYWFDTRPNLRREMEDRKHRFQNKEDIHPIIRDRIQKLIPTGGVFGAVHVFTESLDIPDDTTLRLVVFPPDAFYAKSGFNLLEEKLNKIIKTRGDQPRQRQNRILCLVADQSSVSRLTEQVRIFLAWQSIVNDIKDARLNLDQFQSKQAQQNLVESEEALKRMVREVYKWVMAPTQDVKSDKPSDMHWEAFSLNTSSQTLTAEVEKVLKENEILITDWAPIHLANLLKTWFWKTSSEVGAVEVWQKMGCYLYFPRLKDESVIRAAIQAGTSSNDFFGIAYGKNQDQYSGFSLGKSESPIFDPSLLLIEPNAARQYADKIALEEKTKQSQAPNGSGIDSLPGEQSTVTSTQTTSGIQTKKQFYGTIELDPVRAKMDFSKIVDEVISHFSTRPDAQVNISLDIRAETTSKFEADIQRVVKENCNTLKFKTSEFE